METLARNNNLDYLTIDELLNLLFSLRSKLPEGQLTNVTHIDFPTGSGDNKLTLHTNQYDLGYEAGLAASSE
jgi:hypothetical protein